MKVLITGGAGFIGSNTADFLRGMGHTVVILDDLSTGQRENVGDIPFVECDIRQFADTLAVFDGFKPDAVVHLAAQPAISTSWSMPSADANTNIMGTLNVIDACRLRKVARLVFASTSAVYGCKTYNAQHHVFDRLAPNSPYGVSKLAAESYVQMLFSGHVVLRFGNVYGPRQVPLGENQVIPRMLRHMLYDEPFLIHGDGEQRRDFVYVLDVAYAIEAALTGKEGVYNIASGTRTSVNELAILIGGMFSPPKYDWPHSTEYDFRRDSCMDIRNAKTGLGWEPATPLRVGIGLTKEWWEEQWRSSQT